MMTQKSLAQKLGEGRPARDYMTLACIIACFCVPCSIMGGVYFFNTLINTAFSLLKDTVFYIMAMVIIVGALISLVNEFGFSTLVNKAVNPIIGPLLDMPGSAFICMLTCYMSDSPALLSFISDKEFCKDYHKYQMPALVNLALGMGAIVTFFVLGMSTSRKSYGIDVLIGNIAAFIGCIVSTRLLLHASNHKYGTQAMYDMNEAKDTDHKTHVRPAIPQIKRSIGYRIMDAALRGGKNGVLLSLNITPGILIICTFILILTNGPSANGSYTGAAYEGIGLLPFMAKKLFFIISPLLGLSSPEALAVPIASLGSAAASISMMPQLIASGLASDRDIAVFVAMCICWGGYLSVEVAMLDSMGFRDLSGVALAARTIGGLLAGIIANLLYSLVALL